MYNLTLFIEKVVIMKLLDEGCSAGISNEFDGIIIDDCPDDSGLAPDWDI